jgi:hypothetical protein
MPPADNSRRDLAVPPPYADGFALISAAGYASFRQATHATPITANRATPPLIAVSHEPFQQARDNTPPVAEE